MKKGLEEAENGMKAQPSVTPALTIPSNTDVPEILNQARQLAYEAEKQNNFKVLVLQRFHIHSGRMPQ